MYCIAHIKTGTSIDDMVNTLVCTTLEMEKTTTFSGSLSKKY